MLVEAVVSSQCGAVLLPLMQAETGAFQRCAGNGNWAKGEGSVVGLLKLHGHSVYQRINQK